MSAGIGHNGDTTESGVAAEELKQFVERLEAIEEEIAARNSDKRDVYAELKGRGFDVKAVKSILRIRKKGHAERQEEEAVLELYLHALGMS